MVLMKLFQGRNGDADTENRLVDTAGGGGGRVNRENGVDTHALR